VTLAQAVIEPFREFFSRLGVRRAVLVLAFAMMYKFSESFKDAIVTIFYRDVGFSKTEIGLITKAVVYPAFAIGGAICGICVARYGVRKMLVVFGLIQAVMHAGYLLIAFAGHNYVVLGTTIFIEYIGFATANAAFVAAQMSFTSPAVSATQLALLTSFGSVGQRVFGPLAGTLQAAVGWKGFFAVTIVLCLPGIVLAWFATEPRGSASTSSSASPA